MYTRTHIYMYVYTHTHGYTHTHTQAHTCTGTHTLLMIALTGALQGIYGASLSDVVVKEHADDVNIGENRCWSKLWLFVRL